MSQRNGKWSKVVGAEEGELVSRAAYSIRNMKSLHAVGLVLNECWARTIQICEEKSEA